MEAKNPKVSIIVLTYKSFDNIKRNIESILHQQYDSYEIIISDDGSPNYDKTYLVSLFAYTNNPVEVKFLSREKNIGTVRNYNRAIENAKGDIIVPLSQDDCFYNDKVLSQIVNAFEDDGTNICLGLRTAENGRKILPNKFQQDLIREGKQKQMWYRNACKNMFYGAAVYYRKEYLIKMGLFDEKYDLLEDYPFIMKAIENGENVVMLDEPTVIYGDKGVSSGGFRNASDRIINDQVILRTELCKKATEMLMSRICRRYLDYLLFRWKNAHKRVTLQWFRYPLIVMVIVVTKLVASIKKTDVVDYRFKLLWRIEAWASR